MSSDDILHHMACDFSQWILEIVPEWEDPNEPADAYIDTVHEAFGDSPTKASVISAYKSGAAIAAVQKHMTDFWETDRITRDVARQLVERAIINSFGRDAIA